MLSTLQMACTNPIPVKTAKGMINVPCNQCIACRVSYQESLMFMAQNELLFTYKNGFGASFCCFTYSDENLPENGSLKKEHLQLFNKRCRQYVDIHYNKRRYKFVACGEYGEDFGRAHYHVIFLGLSDVEALAAIRNSWNFGLVDVGPLGRGGLRYVLKYCTKQIKGSKAIEMFDNNGLERPFLIHSKNLGLEWIKHNYVSLCDNNWFYRKNGRMVPVPRYVRNRFKNIADFDSEPVLYDSWASASKEGLLLSDYQFFHAFIKEKMVIDDSRRKGVPIDDSDFIKHKVLVNRLLRKEIPSHDDIIRSL